MHQNIFMCVMILNGDLKGFRENFKTFFQVPPAVSGPDGENTDHSQNQSDCRICRILPTHELSKKWLFFGAFFNKTTTSFRCVGYEMIMWAKLANYHLIPNACSWNDCWLEHNNMENVLYKCVIIIIVHQLSHTIHLWCYSKYASKTYDWNQMKY